MLGKEMNITSSIQYKWEQDTDVAIKDLSLSIKKHSNNLFMDCYLHNARGSLEVGKQLSENKHTPLCLFTRKDGSPPSPKLGALRLQ